MARILILRTDSRLGVADLVEGSGNLGDGIVVVDEVFHLQAGLLHLGHHLRQTEVVRLAHEVGDEFVEGAVVLLRFLVEFQRTGLHHGSQHVVLVVQSEAGGLQPHHPPEVALELLCAGVVASRTVEAVGERYPLEVGHKGAKVVFGFHDLPDFLCLDIVFTWLGDILASKQFVGDIVESCIAVCDFIPFLVCARPSLHVVQQFVHIATEGGHQWQQLLLLHLAQHAVDVEVENLQVEVGGHEVGEVVVVVLLVDLEQLVHTCGHDAETVLAQLLTEQRVEILELCGVDHVLDVHFLIWPHLEVLLLEFVLALLHALDEGLLLIGVLHDVRLVDHAVVEIVERLIFLALKLVVGHVLVEYPHQRVVPRGGQIDVADIGVLEGEASLCSGRVAKRTDIGQRESADVHVVIDTVEQFLHVDLRGRNRHDGLLFLCTGHHEGRCAGC